MGFRVYGLGFGVTSVTVRDMAAVVELPRVDIGFCIVCFAQGECCGPCGLVLIPKTLDTAILNLTSLRSVLLIHDHSSDQPL